MKILAASLVTIIGVAGLTDSPASARTTQIGMFSCEGDRELRLEYSANKVTIYLSSERFDLRQQRSGSGLQYRSRGVSWSEKGKSGFLAIKGGLNIRCTRYSLKTVRAKSRVVPYQCRGGTRVNATYGKQTVVLYVGSERFDLKSQPFVSGALYVGRGVTWHRKGKQGWLVIGGGIKTLCVQVGRKKN